MARSTAIPRSPSGSRKSSPTPARPAPSRSGKPIPWLWLGVAALALGLFVGAVVAFGRSFNGSGSSDAAATGPLSVLHTNDFHALAFSPGDASTVFFGHHNGIMRSADAGRTWTPLVEQRGFDAMGLAVGAGSTLYLAGHDIFMVSPDGGASWQPVSHNLPGTDIHAFANSPTDPNRLFAFVVGHGVFTSADGGRTWLLLESAPADVMALAAGGGSPDALYLASASAGVLRSNDGGRTWAPAAAIPNAQRVFALAADPTTLQAVYAGTDTGVYKSTNGGQAWVKLAYPGKNVIALAISPAQPQRIMAISVNQHVGEVYRSDDAGQTWNDDAANAK